MSHFVEVLDHPELNPVLKECIGWKGRVMSRNASRAMACVRFPDGQEAYVPEVALRPVPKREAAK